MVALENARQAGILERFAKIYVTNMDDSVTKCLVDNLTKQSFVISVSRNGGPYSVKLIRGGASGASLYASSPFMDVYTIG